MDQANRLTPLRTLALASQLSPNDYNTLTSGTHLKPSKLYRITAVCPSDPTPTMHVGDIVACEDERKRSVRSAPDDGWWFVDYLGPEEGYGTLVVGIEEVETAVACKCCGWLFLKPELDQHLAKAHLGGFEQEQAHLREGARLLMLAIRIDTDDMDSEELGALSEEYSEAIGPWFTNEASRQKETLAFAPDGSRKGFEETDSQ